MVRLNERVAHTDSCAWSRYSVLPSGWVRHKLLVEPDLLFSHASIYGCHGFVNYRLLEMGGGNLTLCKRRTLQLLVPYLLWSLAKWAFLRGHTIEGFANIALKPDGYFWFLWALWIITILFIAGDYISQKQKVKHEIIIGAIALILVGIMVILNFRIFGFQFIAFYFMFYAFGYYCNKYRNLLTTSKTIMVVLFAIWIAMGSFWNMHELPFFFKGVPFVPAAMLQYAYRFATSFVAIYLIFTAAPLLLNKGDKYNQHVVHLGQISLGIYVVHLTTIIPLSPWLVSMMPNVPMPVVVLLSFVIATIVSVFIVELLNKNKYTSRYLLGKL